MVFLDLHQYAHVIDMVYQCDIGFCRHHAAPSEVQPAHRLLHKLEEVFH